VRCCFRAGMPTPPCIVDSHCKKGENGDATYSDSSDSTSTELSFDCDRVAKDAAQSFVGPTICGSGESSGSLRAMIVRQYRSETLLKHMHHSLRDLLSHLFWDKVGASLVHRLELAPPL
jgi:hypothetical protein